MNIFKKQPSGGAWEGLAFSERLNSITARGKTDTPSLTRCEQPEETNRRAYLQ
jgi:hypothetical protein